MWYSVPVKEHLMEISMRCGSLIVEADSKELAWDKINKITKNWDDQHYVPPFAIIKGPFKTKEEAEKA